MVVNHEIAYWLQQFLNAVTLASFYIPLALAYALVQGITNKIFLSFGDFAMYATFAAIYAALDLKQSDLDAWIITFASLAVGMICAGALGLFSAKNIIIPLRKGSRQAFMIGSIGMSIVLEEVMRVQSGGRDIWLSPLFDGDSFALISGTFPVQIGQMQIVAISVSIICVGCVLAFAKYSQFGLLWHACSQNEILAKLTGVNTERVLGSTCAISAMLASVSGWNVVTTSGGIDFSLGILLGFKALFASVIGGFGTIAGAIRGGLILAFAETIWTSTFPSDYRDVAVFAAIILILIVNPQGFLGPKFGRESEV